MLGAASGVMLGLLLCLALAACTAGQAPAAAPSPTAGLTATPTISAIATPSGPITITYWETDTDDADVVLDALAGEFMKANPAITVKRGALQLRRSAQRISRQVVQWPAARVGARAR